MKNLSWPFISLLVAFVSFSNPSLAQERSAQEYFGTIYSTVIYPSEVYLLKKFVRLIYNPGKRLVLKRGRVKGAFLCKSYLEPIMYFLGLVAKAIVTMNFASMSIMINAPTTINMFDVA
jgi:hypothetical protein